MVFEVWHDHSKRRERNKRYREKKKQKAKSQGRMEEDYDLDPKAWALAIQFMEDYSQNPIFIHSYMQYLNVLYYDYQKLPEVRITTTYIS